MKVKPTSESRGLQQRGRTTSSKASSPIALEEQFRGTHVTTSATLSSDGHSSKETLVQVDGAGAKTSTDRDRFGARTLPQNLNPQTESRGLQQRGRTTSSRRALLHLALLRYPQGHLPAFG